MRFLLAAALALGASEAATATLDVNCQNQQATVTVSENHVDYSCSNANGNTPSGANPEVDVHAASFTLTLNQDHTIETLNISGSGETPTTLGDDAVNCANLNALRSLTFRNVGFSQNALKLTLPATVKDIHFIDTTLPNLALLFSGNYANLTQIELNGTDFYEIPTFLYEREYSEDVNINVDLSSVNETTTMSAAQARVLNANLIRISASYANACTNNGQNDVKAVSCNFKKSSTSMVPSESSKPSYSNPTGVAIEASNHSSSGSIAGADAGDSGGGVSTGVLVVIIVLVIIIALVLGYFIMKMYFKRKNANAGAHNEATATLMSKGDASGDKGSFISNDDFLRNFRLPQSDVSLIKSVGTGRLWMGEYNEGKVIVKRVESEVTDSYVTKALMAQARTFATISHPNITSLVGVTWLAGTDFAVVTEFMDKGNLKTVLSNSDVNLDVSTKLQMCLDVAQALAYLHETEQNLCAKQLSSRKVLVNSAMTCKLSLFECVPYSTKLGGPNAAAAYSYGMGEVVWLPPEVITRSSPMDARKNNIYAFGVLISEIFTRVSPYQTLVEEQGNTMSDVELVKRVRRQEPMVPHENRREFLEAPASVRQLVEQCLSYAPMSRPTAKDLVDCLQAAKEELQTNSI